MTGHRMLGHDLGQHSAKSTTNDRVARDEGRTADLRAIVSRHYTIEMRLNSIPAGA